MAAAIKCDKCGKYFETYNDQGELVEQARITCKRITPLAVFEKNYDLCPECDDKFTEWMNPLIIPSGIKYTEVKE